MTITKSHVLREFRTPSTAQLQFLNQWRVGNRRHFHGSDESHMRSVITYALAAEMVHHPAQCLAVFAATLTEAKLLVRDVRAQLPPEFFERSDPRYTLVGGQIIPMVVSLDGCRGLQPDFLYLHQPERCGERAQPVSLDRWFTACVGSFTPRTQVRCWSPIISIPDFLGNNTLVTTLN